MSRLLAVVVWSASFLVGSIAHAQLAQTGMVCSQGGMQCRYWLPVDYDPAKSYPLVLYFHGAGQSGSNNTSQVDEWGSMPRAMLNMARRTKYPAFFVAPQAPRPEGDDRWVNWDWGRGSYDINAVPESASMKKALAILATLRGMYNVDPDRIYVMGESMGGFGTWDAIARHPEIFAAGVPTDGGGSPQAAATLRNTAILSAHYSMDGAVPSSSDREMFRAVAAAGGRPTYVEIQQSGHGVAGALVGNEQFYDWLYAQRRGVPPTQPLPHITFDPPGGAQAGAVAVAIGTSIKDTGTQLRYTLNGTVPTASTGTLYSAPVMINTSAILIAGLFSPNDDGDLFAYHAAPFMIGNMALPDGAVIAPVDAGVAADLRPSDAGVREGDAAIPRDAGGGGSAGPGGAGGAGGSAAMPPVGGAGGSGRGQTGGSSGSAGAGGGPGGPSGSAGAPGTGSGGSPGAAVGGSSGMTGRKSSGGCSVGAAASPAVWPLALFGLFALQRRRRRR